LDLGGKVGQRVNDEIMVRVVAKTLLKGWEGLSYKGAEVAYTYDNACLLLGHKDFRALVVEIANDIKTFLVKEEIAQGKT
jgi:aldehyde:ferredoxin oxidoreductase